MLKLVSISEVKTEKVRTDGKASRQYYSAVFSDPNNPFAKTVQRNFFQQHNADGTEGIWKGGNPSEVKQFIGKTIPGEIVSETVEAYQIDGRSVGTYSTVVLSGENKATVFKSCGHVIAIAQTSVVAEKATEVAHGLNM